MIGGSMSVRRVLAACAFVAVFVPASEGAANGGSTAGGVAVAGTTVGTVVFVTSTAGLTSTTLGGIALILYFVNEESDDSKEAYIRRNAIALQRDLTIGGGESVDDLAAAFRIEPENVDAFGRLLRDHRSELLPLTDVVRLNDERADRFFRTIAQGMRSHPELRSELREISVHL